MSFDGLMPNRWRVLKLILTFAFCSIFYDVEMYLIVFEGPYYSFLMVVWTTF